MCKYAKLLPITCWWISAKQDEIYPPDTNDIIVSMPRRVSRKQLHSMERFVLYMLDWRVSPLYLVDGSRVMQPAPVIPTDPADYVFELVKFLGG